MKRWLGGLICLWVMAPISTLWADQCQLIPKDQALQAIERLDVGDTIYEFCEPCGDRTPKPVSVRNLRVDTLEQGKFWRVLVNGQNIDLAYTYVKSSIGSNPINLAVLSDCPAGSVSPVLPPFRR